MNQLLFLRIIPSYIFVFLFLVLISIQYGCGSKTTSEQTKGDSVLVAVDTTVGIDSAALLHLTIIPEDTINFTKVVYVIDKEGTTVYSKMEQNAAMESVLSFGQKLDVLEEYPEWYKVRFRNNSEIYIFYVLKQFTSSDNPINITLFYPAFQVVFGGFIHEEQYVSNIPVPRYYQQNGEEGGEAQIIHQDSVFIYESMDSYDVVKQIRCVPKNNKDQFIISLAYGQKIYEILDPVRPKVQRQPHLHWEELTPYKILPDTGGVFLPTYYNNLQNEEEDLYKSSMSKKHHLKDTIIMITATHSSNVDYVYNNWYFRYSLGSFYLRIQRISDGKIKETRYIIISQNESGC